MVKHCCKQMRDHVKLKCKKHKSVYDCRDVLVSYIPRYDEYGLIIHDGGTSSVEIKFCPWCSKKLPKSKRDLWFERLKKLGFDDPLDQKIPKEFESNEWYRK